MKAIIPVAGAGTQLRPFTFTQPKALIPVAGKPILAFIIDYIKDAGITDFVFVIGYLGEKIRDYVELHHPDIKASFAFQGKPVGLGHAIWSAKEYVRNDEPILIVLGDTIFDVELSHILKENTSHLGVKKVDNPMDFGVAELDKEGKIISVIEKPTFPKSNMALVGLYYVRESSHLFQCLDLIVAGASERKEEIHLTDALQCMISEGIPFKSFKVNHWYDCGKAEILLETNETLLRKHNVVTEEGKYPGSVIINPVSIASSASIKQSIIGPHVTIGEGAEIEHSIIRNSIIGNYTRIHEISIRKSIIGSDAVLKGANRSINIGDNTALDLSSQES